MRCTECGVDNREDARFCVRCGASLPLLCPHCGRELPRDARFCDRCGTSVAAPEAAEEPGQAAARALRRLAPREFAERLLATRGQVSKERRVVTMLFSDVKGSTAMGEELDPEDVTEIMEGAFDVLIEPITRYEGALARLMGDGILAFFGAPIAHEDDGERACRAALEILEGARGYAARLEAERGIAGFNVRVGIHTGLVVVGEVGSDLRVEYTAMGDAVNLASRMEEAAEPGTVLVTEDTHRLVAPLFQTQALGLMEVRGKAEPVSVYRVLAARADVGKPRGIEGLESPLVGRKAEFEALREVLKRLQVGVGGIVTIVGEAGIGKSRLVAELRKEAAPLDLTWVEGRCLSYGESMAYLPWVDMLHSLLGVSAEDAPVEVRDALRRFAERLCPDHVSEVYPFLSRMMSLPLEQDAAERLLGVEPEGLKVLTFRAVERVLESATSLGPVVLVVEDLHWADASSLELVEQVLSLTERCSLLVMCAFRPYREHGCWAIREIASRLYDHRYTDLRLPPLSTVDSEVLVGNLLHVEALPRPLRMRILEHAEGNPFYVEEVIRSLIDSEVVVYNEMADQWQATRGVEDIAIPETLQGVLGARIDRLEEGARRTLQMASVIGRLFAYRVLAAISPGEEGLGGHLSILQREEMIRERARVPELEYIFKHHLTQEAAYDGLLRRERCRFHRQVAEALERLFPDRVEEQLGRLADHWEGAGERERALEYLRRAGEQAAAQYANEEAIGYLSRALELTPEEDLPARFELLLAREGVYGVLAEREVQRRELVVLHKLAEDLDDPSLQAEVALRESECLHDLPDYPRAIAEAQRAVELARAAGDLRREVAGHLQRSSGLSYMGDRDTARSAVEQALTIARAARLRREEAWCLHLLARRLPWGDLDMRRAYHEEAERILREIGDRRQENFNRLFLADVALEQGCFDEARALWEQAVGVFREIGDRWNDGYAHHLPGEVYHQLGDYDRARFHYDEYLRSCREIGDLRGVPMALSRLGLLSHHAGDDETAQGCTEQALRMAREQDSPTQQAIALTWLGHARLGWGSPDDARDAYQQALVLLRELGQSRASMAPLAGLARVHLAREDLDQAQARVEEILDYLETGALDGAREPGRTYLTCYRVLRANGDQRAEGILRKAYEFVQERAAKISDEGERRSYLENVAANREIVKEWSRVRGAG